MKTLGTLILLCLATIVFAADNDCKINATDAQNMETNIKGVVLDKVSGEPLVGVAVKVEGVTEVAYTNFEGEFEFESLKPGNYNIVTNYISYENNVAKNVCTNIANPLKIELEPVGIY